MPCPWWVSAHTELASAMTRMARSSISFPGCEVCRYTASTFRNRSVSAPDGLQSTLQANQRGGECVYICKDCCIKWRKTKSAATPYTVEVLLSLSTAQHTQQAQRHTALTHTTTGTVPHTSPRRRTVLTRSTGTLVPTEVSPAHPHASAASLGVDAHGLEQSGEVKVRARHLRALQLEARRLHGGWVGACVRGVGVCGSRAQPQVPRACNTYAHAHAGHMADGTCGAHAARRAARRAAQRAAQGRGCSAGSFRWQ